MLSSSRNKDHHISIKDKYMHGIRGWLLVLIIFLGFYSWGWLSPSVQNFSMWIYRFNYWEIAYSLLSSFFHLFNIIVPLYLIYLLIRRRRNAVLFSKIFFIAVPVFNILNEYIFNRYSVLILDSGLFVIVTSLSIGLLGLLYLTKSVRVANTYLFSENKFPRIFQCPLCFEKIEVENYERIQKVAVCPACSGNISNQIIAA